MEGKAQDPGRVGKPCHSHPGRGWKRLRSFPQLLQLNSRGVRLYFREGWNCRWWVSNPRGMLCDYTTNCIALWFQITAYILLNQIIIQFLFLCDIFLFGEKDEAESRRSCWMFLTFQPTCSVSTCQGLGFSQTIAWPRGWALWAESPAILLLFSLHRSVSPLVSLSPPPFFLSSSTLALWEQNNYFKRHLL